MNNLGVIEGENQLIFITGGKGIGKTSLAATFLPPNRVGELFYVDSENSANNFLRQLESMDLKIGHYLNMASRFNNLPKDDDLLKKISDGQFPWVTDKERQGLIDYYLYLMDYLKDHLTRGKYSVVVIDTVEKLEAGMGAWVDKNKRKAGVESTAYGKLWSEGVFPLYEALIAAIHDRGVKTVILTSHLKTPWEDNRPVVGKVVPAGKKILYTLSKLCIWLVRDASNPDGAPAGLILKERYGSVSAVDNEWVIRKMIPPRVPHCTWKDIRAYVENGFDGSNLKPGEKLSSDELALVEELTTDKQLELMVLDAKKELLTMQQNSSGFLTSTTGSGSPVVLGADDGLANAIKSVRDANPDMSPLGVAEKASVVLGRTVSLPEVLKLW